MTPEQPFVIGVDDLPDASDASPALAPPPPDDPPKGEAMLAVTALAARKPGRVARWFWGALVSLIWLVVSIAAWDYITALLARNRMLGMIALGLSIVIVLVILGYIARELWAFRRLARIDSFHRDAKSALDDDDRNAAFDLSKRLEKFYSGRSELRWGIQNLDEQRGGVLDADAMIALTERSLFEPLDAEARREIEAASRTVAGATALIPLALADVLAALTMNVRMIRRIAEVYGAHAGFFGSWRLLRSVATHLLATGAVAVGDDMIGSIAGGSALARISRRFGEGVVNGALTARVGIAAMEVCRPLPFSALPRPGVSGLTGRALTGLFQKS
jgi:putative membrane protein